MVHWLSDALKWRGPYYELAIELGPTGDDERLHRAVRQLWSHPVLKGPWTSIDQIGQQPLPSAAILSDRPAPFFGLAILQEARELGCVSHVVRERFGSDWLSLSMPTRMLEHVFEVEYPLAFETNPWMLNVSKLYVHVAEWIFAEIEFQLGIIGEEVSGFTSASRIAATDVEFGGFILPGPLWERLQLTVPFRACSHGLRFVPPTARGIVWGDPYLRMSDVGKPDSAAADE